MIRGGLVFKAHRLLYHSTLGLRVIKKKKKHHPERGVKEVLDTLASTVEEKKKEETSAPSANRTESTPPCG